MILPARGKWKNVSRLMPVNYLDGTNIRVGLIIRTFVLLLTNRASICSVQYCSTRVTIQSSEIITKRRRLDRYRSVNLTNRMQAFYDCVAASFRDRVKIIIIVEKEISDTSWIFHVSYKQSSFVSRAISLHVRSIFPIRSYDRENTGREYR